MNDEISDKEHLSRLNAATSRILTSQHPKKLIVAGPGAGKTTSFKKILTSSGFERDKCLVFTFLGALKNDIEKELGANAQVFTFHGYCHHLLRKFKVLRVGLGDDFEYYPALDILINSDWEVTKGTPAPDFKQELRLGNHSENTDFYIERSNYYNAIGFDDSVFRTYFAIIDNPDINLDCELVLVDEFQDFNKVEADFVRLLSNRSKVVVAGDDDQSLYQHMRLADPAHIQDLFDDTDFENHELPYCTRCTKPIIDAVNSVIQEATRRRIFPRRIEKNFNYCPPIKRTDSENYPRVIYAKTSTQTPAANYFAKYIASEIQKISQDEIRESHEKGFPAALVIAPNPFRTQIVDFLKQQNLGTIIEKQESQDPLSREFILRRLVENPDSGLWWRAIVELDRPPFYSSAIESSITTARLFNLIIQAEYRERILAEGRILPDELVVDGAQAPAVDRPIIQITSFEGSKGLSAQHVFIAGLQNGSLPRRTSSIQAVEVRRFLVALTRTRKSCHLVYSNFIGGRRSESSEFLNWIPQEVRENRNINRHYFIQ